MAKTRRISRKLLVLTAALALLPSGGALASQAYPEQVGDAPGGAPDVASLNVSHKLAGDVSFAVTFANRTTLAGEDVFVLVLDSDQDPNTGRDGEDYFIGVAGSNPTTATLFGEVRIITIPAGTVDWMSIPLTDLPVSWTGKTMSITFDRKELEEKQQGLNFLLLSHTGGDPSAANTEEVPHTGWWSYSFATSIEGIQLAAPVAKVKAGKVFSVRGATVKLTTEEVFRPETLTAKATVGGKPLKPLAGGLSWKVPKTAKGKKLVVTMSAAYQGMAKTQTLTLKIVK